MAISRRYRPVAARDDEEESSSKRKKQKGKAGAPTPGRPGWSRNPAFEDLCAIFEAGFTDRGRASAWLRRYVLGRIEWAKDRVAFEDTGARSWGLARLFLEEVLGMNKGRIEAIRGFADKLAAWVVAKHDRKLLRALSYEKMWGLRSALLRAQRESAGSALLFGLDEFATVWLHEDGDQYLVRDLVCLRVIEELHKRGYFNEHPEEALVTPVEDDNKEREEAV
jgi:CRISPR-associated protein Cst1